MAEEGILSQEEMEEIGLEPDQVKVLKGCFDGFADEDGAIPADNVGGILSMMGMKVKPSALKEIIEEIDEDGRFNQGYEQGVSCSLQTADINVGRLI